MTGQSFLRLALPAAVFALAIGAWDLLVIWNDIPPYVLPGPGKVVEALIEDRAMFAEALAATLLTALEGFLLAGAGGIAIAMIFYRFRLIETALYPIAVALQVTPVLAVAPLLLIYLPQHLAVLACAWIVAFFPVLSNTTLGLKSADRNLADLFRLYGASRWQEMRWLRLPSALPHILGGLRIAGGLSLIGAVVAEIAAGSAGAGAGLAFRIAEAGYRLNVPRMFAALALLAAAGIAIFLILSLASHLLLRRWHESASEKEI